MHVARLLDQNRPGRAFLRPTLSSDVPSLSLDDGKKRIVPPDHRTGLLDVATSSSSVRSAAADRGEKGTQGHVRCLRGRGGRWKRSRTAMTSQLHGSWLESGSGGPVGDVRFEFSNEGSCRRKMRGGLRGRVLYRNKPGCEL